MFGNKNIEATNAEAIAWFMDVLPEEKINKLGLLLRSFDYGEISYKDFKAAVKQEGLDVVSAITPSLEQYKLLSQAQELTSRIQTDELLASDVSAFVLSDAGKRQISFKSGRDLLEVMAKFGDKLAKEQLVAIDIQQEKHLSQTPEQVTFAAKYAEDSIAVDERWKKR